MSRRKNPAPNKMLILGALAAVGIGAYLYMNSSKAAEKKKQIAKLPPKAKDAYDNLITAGVQFAAGKVGPQVVDLAKKAFLASVPGSAVDDFGDPILPPVQVGDNLTPAQEAYDNAYFSLRPLEQPVYGDPIPGWSNGGGTPVFDANGANTNEWSGNGPENTPLYDASDPNDLSSPAEWLPA